VLLAKGNAVRTKVILTGSKGSLLTSVTTYASIDCIPVGCGIVTDHELHEVCLLAECHKNTLAQGSMPQHALKFALKQFKLSKAIEMPIQVELDQLRTRMDGDEPLEA
jgi:hypothetical protein